MITAGMLEDHLNCDVEINKYDDGTLTLECNTCEKIIFCIKSDQITADCEPEPTVIEFDGTNGSDVELVGATFDDEPVKTENLMPEVLNMDELPELPADPLDALDDR